MPTLPHIALILGLLLGAAGAAAAGSRPPLGTNVNGLSYWSTALPLRDAFKTSGPWLSGTKEEWSDGRALDLDARGWVRRLEAGQVANTALFSGTANFGGALAKRYVVEYRGEGRLDYGELAELVERGKGRDVVAIKAGPGNATLTLVATDPNDPLRDIRVTAGGAKAGPGELFNPLFLAQLKGYRALRFMNWMLGDGEEDIAARRWSARPTLEDARWTVKGAPVELMVALANRVRGDPWFTMPHAADDDYVRRFAQTVKKSLDPGLKVYLEYSNEVWNTVYPQTAYAREKGLALGLGPDPDEAVLRYYAKRAAEVFAVWEEVFPKERLVRVLAFQSDIAPEYADAVALAYADTRKHVDALAIGPYFGTDLAADAAGVERVGKLSLDGLMRELESSSLPKAKAQMRAHAAFARAQGLPLLAYEGGQHLWNMSGRDSPGVARLFHAANRDPRMGSLYARYLLDWAEAGGGLFMHLLDCGLYKDDGNWGALEHPAQPRAEAPKYDALMRFAEGK